MKIKRIGREGMLGTMIEIRCLFSIMMSLLSIIVLMVINADFVYAIEVVFNAPQEVDVGEEFDVTIAGETSEVYDVKIYVGEISNYLSKIYRDNLWKSPHLYIKEAFPTQKTFSIKVENFTGDSQLCVQLRKGGQTNFDKKCQPIKVKDDGQAVIEEDEEEEEQEENNGVTDNNVLSFVPLNNEIENETIEEKNEKIILKGKSSSNYEDKNKVVYSIEGKAQRYVLYAFIVFVVFISIFIIFRKL